METDLAQSDPTRGALATIASILHHKASPSEAAKPAAEEKSEPAAGAEATEVEADGYSKVGPGPMEAVRLRWTVRHAGDGKYYVDETVGENSQAVSTGPMSAEAAVSFVDDQASEARQRFEALRNEIAGRAAAASVLGKNDI